MACSEPKSAQANFVEIMQVGSLVLWEVFWAAVLELSSVLEGSPELRDGCSKVFLLWLLPVSGNSVSPRRTPRLPPSSCTAYPEELWESPSACRPCALQASHVSQRSPWDWHSFASPSAARGFWWNRKAEFSSVFSNPFRQMWNFT